MQSEILKRVFFSSFAFKFPSSKLKINVKNVERMSPLQTSADHGAQRPWGRLGDLNSCLIVVESVCACV